MRTTSTSISFPFKKPPSQKRKGHFSNIYESFAKLPTKITSINREKTPLIEFNVSERILEGYMDEKTQFILEKNSFDDKITKKKGLIKGISMKNQVIINEIKQKCKKTNFHIEKNENNDIIDKLMIKPSIKTRYEELTKEKTEYTLPSSYKALLKVFEAIDETLNFLKMRNIPSFFEEIKEDIKIMGL